MSAESQNRIFSHKLRFGALEKLHNNQGSQTPPEPRRGSGFPDHVDQKWLVWRLPSSSTGDATSQIPSSYEKAWLFWCEEKPRRE